MSFYHFFVLVLYSLKLRSEVAVAAGVAWKLAGG